MALCLCGSKKEFDLCCEPHLTGATIPATPEELLRSRYVAYATQKIDYIAKTTHASKKKEFNKSEAEEWSANAVWEGLQILGTPAEDQVEFIVRYQLEGQSVAHHEIATFKKEKKSWFFFDSMFPKAGTIVNSAPKIGRNDPCSCGSGVKYKKCCGK